MASKANSLFPALLNLPYPKEKQTETKSDKIVWGRLVGSSQALAIAEAATHSSRVNLVITSSTPQAHRLEAEIKSLLTEEVPVYTFPDWEILPYDTFSPHQDIISQRLLALYKLPLMTQGVVIVPISTLLHFVAPTEYVTKNSFIFKTGETTDINKLSQTLVTNGYRQVEQVIEHGEFSVRGSILDMFPMGSEHPFRIDFFDDEIDSIRVFDPETQRSRAEEKEISILPAHEFPSQN